MKTADLEVELDHENGTAIIRGKTNIPFSTLVSLVLQRKVHGLLKKWKEEPVVLSSELLTSLASAPDDNVENRGKLVTVTLAAGVYLGVLLTAAALLLLSVVGIAMRPTELAIICGVLLGFAVLVILTQRFQRKASKRQTLLEKMEKLTDLLTK